MKNRVGWGRPTGSREEPAEALRCPWWRFSPPRTSPVWIRVLHVGGKEKRGAQFLAPCCLLVVWIREDEPILPAFAGLVRRHVRRSLSEGGSFSEGGNGCQAVGLHEPRAETIEGLGPRLRPQSNRGPETQGKKISGVGRGCCLLWTLVGSTARRSRVCHARSQVAGTCEAVRVGPGAGQ